MELRLKKASKRRGRKDERKDIVADCFYCVTGFQGLSRTIFRFLYERQNETPETLKIMVQRVFWTPFPHARLLWCVKKSINLWKKALFWGIRRIFACERERKDGREKRREDFRIRSLSLNFQISSDSHAGFREHHAFSILRFSCGLEEILHVHLQK